MHIQQNALQLMFKESFSTFSSTRLTWKGNITPSPLSVTYTLKLVYKLGDRPKIFVLHPKLGIPGGSKLPHVYSEEKKQLCLYYPDGKEWNNKKLIAKTIIPWSAEWLFHYEIWAVTGKWNGGGIHPEDKIMESKEENP